MKKNIKEEKLDYMCEKIGKGRHAFGYRLNKDKSVPSSSGCLNTELTIIYQF